MRDSGAAAPESEKSLALYALLNFVLPGAGEIYLGPATRRQGLLTFALLALCIPLIFVFGLGLFLAAFVWFTTQTRTVSTLLRMRRARSASAR
jgi:TM2 domain-containing membrane protein YozV